MSRSAENEKAISAEKVAHKHPQASRGKIAHLESLVMIQEGDQNALKGHASKSDVVVALLHDEMGKMKLNLCRLEALQQEKERELVKSKKECDSLALQLHEANSKSLSIDSRLREAEGSLARGQAQVVMLEAAMQVKSKEMNRQVTP